MNGAFIITIIITLLSIPVILYYGFSCDNNPNTIECIAKDTGEPIQISDSDGVIIYKIYRDSKWVYYSIDAKEVHYTETYQCGLLPIFNGKTTTFTPQYCNKTITNYGDINE